MFLSKIWTWGKKGGSVGGGGGGGGGAKGLSGLGIKSRERAEITA